MPRGLPHHRDKLNFATRADAFAWLEWQLESRDPDIISAGFAVLEYEYCRAMVETVPWASGYTIRKFARAEYIANQPSFATRAKWDWMLNDTPANEAIARSRQVNLYE